MKTIIRITANRCISSVVYFFGLMICLVMITACTTGSLGIVPAITPSQTGTYHVGEFVWFDLLTNDVPGMKRFYGELFSWEFEGDPSDDSSYTTIKKDHVPIGSIIYVKREDEKVSESQWLSSLSVSDVDKATDYLRHNGGVVITEPKEFPDRGRISVVRDPQGALLSLLRSTNGDPPEGDLGIGKWIWNELWTTDLNAAINFYKTLVGYEDEPIDLPTGETYHQMKSAYKIGIGVVLIPWEDVEPNWLPYIAVSDIAATVEHAKALGGEVLIEPDEIITDNSVAIIADPSGAAFAIQGFYHEKGKEVSQ